MQLERATQECSRLKTDTLEAEVVEKNMLFCSSFSEENVREVQGEGGKLIVMDILCWGAVSRGEQ